ncbi:MAG: phosphatase PAP2 family protein [Rubricoccaceae bacterium]|nr:phosphatase PAP2 family protein [Rubricoccaceae bacterium]
MRATTSHADSGQSGYRIASAISYAVNPLVLPPICFGLVLWVAGAAPREIWLTVGVVVVFFFITPLLYLRKMVQSGEAETLEVRKQQRRTEPFIVGVASYIAGLLVLGFVLNEARGLALMLGAIFPVNTLIVTAINLRWKISVHVMSIAGFVAALGCIRFAADHVAPASGIVVDAALLIGACCIPLLMWARVRAGAHTPSQVIGGALFGFLVTALELTVLLYCFPALLAV